MEVWKFSGKSIDKVREKVIKELFFSKKMQFQIAIKWKSALRSSEEKRKKEMKIENNFQKCSFKFHKNNTFQKNSHFLTKANFL